MVYPASQQALTMAQNWLQTCLRSHLLCNKPKRPQCFTPSRLLEIRNISSLSAHRRLRLREVDERSTYRYAALSYCWGGDQVFKTTKSRLESYRTNIEERDLPLTIRDGILVTQRLGLRFLWVDALCIIQDDDLDKVMEINSMPHIYIHATITITASRASGSREGFLGKRPSLGYEAPYKGIQLGYRCENGTQGSIVIIPSAMSGNLGPYPDFDPAEPLDGRAWAFQEKILSSRILDFGTFKTQWICGEKKTSQTKMGGRFIQRNKCTTRLCLFEDLYQVPGKATSTATARIARNCCSVNGGTLSRNIPSDLSPFPLTG